MAYQVIARKWRPQTFEEVTGQESITRTLRNAVEHDRVHHAYLFSGARGVGKTTTARLLAKALNCRKTVQPNVKPCAATDETVCESCLEISESRSIDVLEIDAASHTGIDDIRETILESINFNPARDRFKVFIIDEVHQLSKAAFNALLKTLEEPPPRVVFIMATTELHKVPDTILSRCQEFEFRTISTDKIFKQLRKISEAEKIEISDDALRSIARSGEGSMRDAQSNFDQVISFSGEKIGNEDVRIALGIAGAEMLTRISQAIAENKPGEALFVVDELIGRGQDLRNFCRDLLSFFRDLLIFKMASENEKLLDTAVLNRTQMKQFAEPFSESDLIRFFNSLGETETKLREATQPRYVLEIGLVKLIEMRRVVPIEKILERLAKIESVQNNKIFESIDSDPKKTFESVTGEPEKKTLRIDFPPEEISFPVSIETIKSVSGAPAVEMGLEINEVNLVPEYSRVSNIKSNVDFIVEKKEKIFPEHLPPESDSAAAPDKLLQLIETMPLKLLPITSEELEHIEDNWLDAEFERRLQQSGDNLTTISNIAKITASLLGTSSNGGNGNKDIKPVSDFQAKVDSPSAFGTEDIGDELPVLPDNPTPEELWHYAENHPFVKKALRIFRGKIVEVEKRVPPKNLNILGT